MKWISQFFKLFWLFGIVIFLTVAPAESAQIRTSKAFLRSSPDYKSDKLLALDFGEEVSVLAEKGNWKKVEAKGQVGWILQMNLEQNRFSGKISSQDLKNKNRYKSRGIRTRVAAAAVGVKGLRASRVEQIEDNYDMDALKTMESYTVNEETATEFVLSYSEKKN